MKLIIIKNERNGKISKKGAYIFNLKKNGERYSNPCFVDACGMETEQEDVLLRIQSLNPTKKFELAGIEEYKSTLKLQY